MSDDNESIYDKAKAAGHTHICLSCFESGNTANCKCGFEATDMETLNEYNEKYIKKTDIPVKGTLEIEGKTYEADPENARLQELLDSTLAQLHATQKQRDHAREKCEALAESVLDNWREVKKAKADQNLYEQAYNNGLIEGRYRQTIKLTEAGQEAYEKGIGPKAVAERWKAVARAVALYFGGSSQAAQTKVFRATLDGNLDDVERLLGIGDKDGEGKP